MDVKHNELYYLSRRLLELSLQVHEDREAMQDAFEAAMLNI